MLEIKSEVLIKAPVEAVWEVVTNMKNYSDWNSQISLLNGKVEVGQKIRIRYKPLFYKSFTVKPCIHQHKPLRSFGWKGFTRLPKMLNGEYVFDLKELGEEATQLRYTQRYSGLLSFLLPRFEVFKDARKSCIKMNAEIKKRVEETFASQAVVMG